MDDQELARRLEEHAELRERVKRWLVKRHGRHLVEANPALVDVALVAVVLAADRGRR